MTNKPNVNEDGQEVRDDKAENARARRGLRGFAQGGVGRRGGVAEHRAGEAGAVTASQREEVFNMPSIAITTKGKVLERWEKGGNSHWVVGDTRLYDSVSYRLQRIQKTAGVCYLICEVAR